MALILNTARPLPDLSSDEIWYVYNGLDCAVTSQVYSRLTSILQPNARDTYAFQMSLQPIAMEMMLRGLRVDPEAVARIIAIHQPRVVAMENLINRYAHAIWRKPLNVNSPVQMKDFLYNVMKLPIQYKRTKDGKQPTANREALEALHHYYYAEPIISAILQLKDDLGVVKVLRSGVDSDGRMRFSFNIGGTETGRWSSSQNPFGSGTNGQNITDLIRQIFVPDPGYIFANFDLVTAESVAVGYLSGDDAYIDACLSGDLHTRVAKLIWDTLPWGEDPKGWRAIADQPFYRHFSYRDLSKRGGHASNYYALPNTVARHLHIPLATAEAFQNGYFTAFPKIPEWHISVAAQVQQYRRMVTALGRERQFFGRPDSRDTLKEAIAYEPQSLIADTINKGARQVWRRHPYAQFLMQVHDSILVQVPITHFQQIPIIARDLTITTPVNGRDMTIAVEAAYGWNWGKMNLKRNKDGTPTEEYNEFGLRKWGANGPQKQQLDQRVP